MQLGTPGRASLAGPAVRFLFAVVGTVAYLGARNRRLGRVCGVLLAAARIVLTTVALGMTGAALAAGGNVSAGVREDRGNRWVIPAFTLIGLLDAFLPAYTERKGDWILGGDAVRWLGVALFAGGGALRIWPVFVLGHRFSGLVAIQREHTLVTNGIYSIIRHPSYLGLLSTHWAGGWPFVRYSACCWRYCWFLRYWHASTRKSGCSKSSSGASTTSIAPAPPG